MGWKLNLVNRICYLWSGLSFWFFSLVLKKLIIDPLKHTHTYTHKKNKYSVNLDVNRQGCSSENLKSIVMRTYRQTFSVNMWVSKILSQNRNVRWTTQHNCGPVIQVQSAMQNRETLILLHLQPTYYNTRFVPVILAKDESGISNISIPKRQRLIQWETERNPRSLTFRSV